jgi:predicted flap endonuclease-1-like 5' DNA nuclease
VTATSQLIRQSQAELTQYQGQLDDLTRDLEEKRFLYREHKAEIDGLQAQLSSHQNQSESLVLAIQKSLEEVEALQTAEQQHLRKRDRLMQTVQNLTNELSLIESTVQSRSLEIQEAEKIRSERDLVLNRLQRERRILETEINRVHQDIDELDSSLQQLSERQRQLTYSVEQVPADPSTSSRAKLPDDHDTPAPFTPDDEWEFLPNDVALLQGEDDLAAIIEINSFYRDLLHKKGIRTYAQIAYAKPDELRRLLDLPPQYKPDIDIWIERARALFKQQAATEL